VEPGLSVLNMVAQHGLAFSRGLPPIRYDALALCLRHADSFAKRAGASLHMPRIGCGLGGGSWKIVGGLVERLTTVDVVVYDWPGTGAA
jgi:O-acetyl-ADP-ribose deacetylase (regulator of RNase III)